MTWTPPETFDGYRLIRTIGQGGMGQVVLAHDTLLDRPVAVKFIAAADADESERQLLFVEARAIARIQHPNVVAVYRVGEVDGRPYLVSEFVRGEGLDRVPLPVPWTRALAIGMGIARGLSTAHRHGVVHRDIKPANILLSEDGEPKLLDFGIAKLLDQGLSQPVPSSPAEALGELAALSVERPRIANQDDETRPVPKSACAVPPPEAGELREPAEDGKRLRSLLEASPPVPSVAREAPRVMGTPRYMAPEVWRGEEATFRSDVYSLGALLYALCTGKPPHTGSSIPELGRRVVSVDATPLATVAPSVDPRFAAIVDRCLCRDPARRFASGGEVRAALAQLTPEARIGVVPEGNPYRGLYAFETQHSALFFGRDSEIRALLERLRTEPCIAVTGDSGVGKSSICRAGVLPRIQSWLAGDRHWTSVTLVPGTHPIAALAAALAAPCGIAEAELAQRMTEDPSFPARELRGKLGRESGLIIFVDQLEELATLSDPREASTAAEVLGWLVAPSTSLRVLAAVRGDFLGRLAALPAVGDAVARSLYVLRPLSSERIRDAITGPAQALAVRFASDAMVEALVASTVDAEGGLPLLQFALAELWEARDPATGVIPVAALAALGGVEGALSRHADDVLARMIPPVARAARRVLLGLVTAAGTRARRTEEELGGADAHARTALAALVRGRLVVARESADGTVHEIAHEALLHGWGTLARWLATGSDTRVVRERLGAAVAEWQRLGRAREALWSARQLDEIAALDASELSPDEGAFVTSSRHAVRRGRMVRAAAIVAVPLALAVGCGAVAIGTRRALVRKIDAHLARAGAALVEARAAREEASAHRREAFARFDDLDREHGERAWARALAAEAKTPPLYGRASQELETAIMLDPGRHDLRERFADLLYERALVAEEQSPSQRDELDRRLAVYDDGGVRARLLRAPASLAIATKPAGARATIARYVEAEPGRLGLEPARALGSTPVADVELEPGSYVVRISAPDRAPIRYPIVLAREEHATVSIDLPALADVPPGFVYVAPGRFLFGSAADDSIRRTFFNTAPIHAVTTGPYLIARSETTFGDWIDYLRALPPAERKAHYPRIDGGGFKGALAFEELPGDAFQLSFQPAGQLYRAASGELVRYPARHRRAAQDWLRLPVFGVDVADAEAYLRWLDATGRVRRARLCTEHEWERAARGSDGRTYPHGAKLDADDADFDETYDKEPLAMGPDEVGSHPSSQSPFGLDDAAGNVWEWTTSSLARGEYAARGGSFYFNANSSRSDNREVSEPSLRDVSMGLRVCADVADGMTAR